MARKRRSGRKRKKNKVLSNSIQIFLFHAPVFVISVIFLEADKQLLLFNQLSYLVIHFHYLYQLIGVLLILLRVMELKRIKLELSGLNGLS